MDPINIHRAVADHEKRVDRLEKKPFLAELPMIVGVGGSLGTYSGMSWSPGETTDIAWNTNIPSDGFSFEDFFEEGSGPDTLDVGGLTLHTAGVVKQRGTYMAILQWTDFGAFEGTLGDPLRFFMIYDPALAASLSEDLAPDDISPPGTVPGFILGEIALDTISTFPGDNGLSLSDDGLGNLTVDYLTPDIIGPTPPRSGMIVMFGLQDSSTPCHIACYWGNNGTTDHSPLVNMTLVRLGEETTYSTLAAPKG